MMALHLISVNKWRSALITALDIVGFVVEDF
jgi:hypothetical protein